MTSEVILQHYSAAFSFKTMNVLLSFDYHVKGIPHHLYCKLTHMDFWSIDQLMLLTLCLCEVAGSFRDKEHLSSNRDQNLKISDFSTFLVTEENM